MKISPYTVWYAPGDDSYCFERVQVIRTVILPSWGRYIFYKQIDHPDSAVPHPFCVHESTFLRLYTPQESEPCATQLPANSSSKTSWLERLFFFIKPRMNSGNPPPPNPNS